MSVWGNPKKLIFSYADGCDYLSKKAGILCNLPLGIRGSHLLSSEFTAIHAPKDTATADTTAKAEPAYATTTAARAAKRAEYKRDELDRTIYALANGEGKVEAFDVKGSGRSGHFARPDHWQTTIISTGAEKITYPDCLSTPRTKVIEVPAVPPVSIVSGLSDDNFMTAGWSIVETRFALK